MESLLLYDGNCGFCKVCAEWAESRGVAIAPWQSLGDEGLAARGLRAADFENAAWFVAADGKRSRGSAAIGRTLILVGGPYWLLGWMLLIPPFSWVARIGYRWVANNRQKMGWLADWLRKHQ